MRFLRPIILLPACAAVLAGCRNSGNADALMYENRQLDEKVTALEVQLDKCCRELRATREQLAVQLAESSSGTPTPARSGSPTPANGSSPSDKVPPKVELGPSGGETPRKGDSEPAPKFVPGTKTDYSPNGDSSGPELGAMHNVAARNNTSPDKATAQVRAITLDPKLTMGYEADPSQPGDDGLIVVVQPRGLAGELIRAAGQIRISAYDAELWEQLAQQPELLRESYLAAWDFNPADAATWFDDDQHQLSFELPWPQAHRPRIPDLRLIVTYETIDGRTLESQLPVTVQLTGRGTAPATQHATSPISQREQSVLKSPVAANAHGAAGTSTTRAPAGIPSRPRPAWSPVR